MSTTASSISGFRATGKVIACEGNMITFAPAGTTYELQLEAAQKYTGPMKTPVDGCIRVKARRLWTVPSGGNFVTPIMGPPKCIQGRVRFVGEKEIVVHAAVPFIVTLPEDANAMDMNRGPIAEGSLVNVVCFAGATFSND